MRVAFLPTFKMPRLPALMCVLAVQLLMPVCGRAVPNPQEAELGDYLVGASGQQRPFMKFDPTLNEVARQRAQDMARRDYFSHVDPDGNGPNYHVEQAGYQLPDAWPDSRSANYIESIAAGRPSADSTWSDFMGSSAHKSHLLAEEDFYQEQTSYGVGYAYDAGSKYRHYWVVITAPPQPVPALKITSPAANARLKSDSVEVSGTTGGPGSPQQVLVRVENSSGGTPFQTATGVSNWRASLTGLQPGVNTIHVRSVNASGVVIAEASRKVTYVVMAPLLIEVNGNGAVTSGFLGHTQRQVGARYTVVAKPAAGYLFSGWSGDMSGASSSVTFTMPESLSLVANFVPNPFIFHRGTYLGAVSAEDLTAGGLVTATINSTGRVSGKIRVGTSVAPFLTQLGLDGTATVSVQRKNLPALTLHLVLDLVSGTGLSVAVLDGVTSLAAQMDRVATKSRLNVRVGKYSVSIQAGQTDEANAPKGAGFGVVRVNRSGGATIVGYLADGKKFSQATAVTDDGTIAVYSPLYSSGGFVAGELQFRTTESSDVDGLLNWRKPPNSDPLFPEGFVTTVPVVGSLAIDSARAGR